MGCAGRRKLDYVWRTLFEVAANGSKHNITTVGSTAAAPPPPTPPTPSTISSNSMYLRGQFNRPVPSWRQWASRQDNGVHAPPHYPEHTVPHAAHSTESAGSAKAQAERVEAKVPALAARRRRHVPNFHPYSMSTTMCSTKMMASTVTPTVRPPRARRSSTISILHLQKRHRRLKQDSQGQTLTNRACTRTSGERLASCKKRVACTPCSLHRLPFMQLQRLPALSTPASSCSAATSSAGWQWLRTRHHQHRETMGCVTTCITPHIHLATQE